MPTKPTLPLEHKSSLRKLPFPQSAAETLLRVRESSTKHAKNGKRPNPKEMEAIVDVIDEFVFGGGGGLKNKDLILVSTLFDFFRLNEDDEDDVDDLTFELIFTEPRKSSNNRLDILAKLMSLAFWMPSASTALLRCAGSWMKRRRSDLTPRRLAIVLIEKHVLLCDAESFDALKTLPSFGPLFASEFVNVASENFLNPQDGSEKPPPKRLLRLIVCWSESLSSLEIAPIFGLVRWTTSATLLNLEPAEDYSRLHLAILERLCAHKRQPAEKAPEVLPVKRITCLIQHVVAATKAESSSESGRQEALDRLGQFLHGISSVSVSGKTTEIIDALERLPANRLIGLYVMNLAKIA